MGSRGSSAAVFFDLSDTIILSIALLFRQSLQLMNWRRHLQMVMRDTRVKQSEESDAQTALMQKTIESYFSEQGFSLPCDSSDEMERFLEYLAKDLPEVWNYFRVITKES